jgi:hypothetical protein
MALGCRAESALSELRALAVAITREYGRGDAQVMRRVDEMLLSRPVLLAEAPDSAILARLAASSGTGRLEAAAAALARHDKATARVRLSVLGSQPSIGPQTPDVLLPEVRLWLGLADTAVATERLDLSLTNVRDYDPEDFAEQANVAAFIRAMALRADLAAAAGDSVRARRWATAVATLWSNADPDLQPLLKRMSRYAVVR